MFSFLDMINDYESRKVARYEDDDITVSTAAVSDAEKPFETGIYHPEYNDGKCIIIEAYDTKEEAQIGHDKWVGIITSESLPTRLIDCSNSKISQLAEAVGCDMCFERESVDENK